MQRITYAGGAFITGDDIAEAVVEHAETLARHGMVEVVDLQVRRDDGSPGRARLLLGQALPIASEHVDVIDPFDGGDLLDEEGVAGLRSRTRGIGHARSLQLDGQFDSGSWDYEFDL